MISSTIIKRCQSQERDAQRCLYEQCAPYVYSIIKSYVQDRNFQKDVMQESFASIFTSLSKFDPSIGKFKSWISQITTYRCIDFLKKNEAIQFSADLTVIEELDDKSYQMMTALTKEEIYNMLQQMPTGYRTIFLLHVIDDYSHIEISELLNITPETSRSQLSRALSWMRKNIALINKVQEYGTL